jgi:hypothetical protein
MRRRNGSAYNNLLGSGSGARNRPIAPGESGPCCQDSPIALPPIKSDQPQSRVELVEVAARGALAKSYAAEKTGVNAILKALVIFAAADP